jgi:hypothetical protein
VASIASDLAWTTRRVLRAHGLSEDVSVAAEWRTVQSAPSLADATMTVTVPEAAEALSAELEDVLAERIAARSPGEPPRLRLRCVG